MAPILFWDVDTQADFVYPEGKLYVPGAETIVPNLKRLTDWAAAHEVLVIASACAHQPGDAEFAQYPPHCLAGTPGQQKIPVTRLANAVVIPNRWVELPQDVLRHPQIVIEKQKLDVFSNPNTERLLELVSEVEEIILYGVVTEICVAYAAGGLARRGYRVRVIRDAIRHLEEGKAERFLGGVGTTTTEEIVRELSRRRAA